MCSESRNYRPSVLRQVAELAFQVYRIYFMISTPRPVFHRQPSSDCSRTEALPRSSRPRSGGTPPRRQVYSSPLS